jgi:hypothetical protein
MIESAFEISHSAIIMRISIIEVYLSCAQRLTEFGFFADVFGAGSCTQCQPMRWAPPRKRAKIPPPSPLAYPPTATEPLAASGSTHEAAGERVRLIKTSRRRT